MDGLQTNNIAGFQPTHEFRIFDTLITKMM